ncbi:MAG: ACT domain-containing protein [Acutalibacteraceae bacterium]|nr:ACT domain-containing protein [Acutalibacteraceae bacterium]MEE0264348.1 ACT domain-containing protein [Acutalibacteraceae bacterium]
MRAFITVLGKDTVGILAKVSSACAEENISVSEVTQSVLQEMFVMIMLVDMSESKKTIAEMSTKLDKLGEEMGLKIHIMHEDIFNSMHRI